jgi:hypothetical protein
VRHGAIGIDVECGELLSREPAAASAFVGRVDDDQDVDRRDNAVGVDVERRRGGDGGLLILNSQFRIRSFAFVFRFDSEFRILTSEFFRGRHGSNLREEFGGEDDARVEMFEAQTPRARLR